jgi:hypothetical protein
MGPGASLGAVLMSFSETVAQLRPQTMGTLFVAFYDFLSYSGGILTYLHTNIHTAYSLTFTIERISMTGIWQHSPCVYVLTHGAEPFLRSRQL